MNTNENKQDSEQPISPILNVKLPAWEWHYLLLELEEGMKIGRRNLKTR